METIPFTGVELGRWSELAPPLGWEEAGCEQKVDCQPVNDTAVLPVCRDVGDESPACEVVIPLRTGVMWHHPQPVTCSAWHKGTHSRCRGRASGAFSGHGETQRLLSGGHSCHIDLVCSLYPAG